MPHATKDEPQQDMRSKTARELCAKFKVPDPVTSLAVLRYAPRVAPVAQWIERPPPKR